MFKFVVVRVGVILILTSSSYLAAAVKAWRRQLISLLNRCLAFLPGMAPHPGVDTDQIKEKARKDLLDLLEGVCKAPRNIMTRLL